MKKLLSIFMMVLNLSACTLSPPVNYDTLSLKLTTGMTKQQVINILGEPTYKEIAGNKEKYKYESSSHTSATIGNILLLPIEAIGQTLIFEGSKSILWAYFDENGLLESYHTY